MKFFLASGGSVTGWTLYPPLSTRGAPGVATDMTFLTLHARGVRRVAGGLQFLGTVTLVLATSCRRKINWHPFVWTILVTVFLLILSLPVLAGGVTIGLIERNFNTLFFEREGGGNPILFQHLFWFFGHPEVYVLILPAFGVVSLLSQRLANLKNIFGPHGMLLAILAIGFIGCLV